ncbi:phosphatidate cytidylyltransferase [Ascidiaceihabitans sp.]|nr:phosphatidate cytidylyltransferase [Ascidiaceihabitans sp.]
MSGAPKWSDLTIRLSSAILMVVVGLLGLLIGGHVFHLLVGLICGLMMWELVRMVAPLNAPLALQLGLLSAFVSFIAIYIPTGFALPLLLSPAFIGFAQLAKNRVVYMVFSVMVLLAGFGMMSVRDDLGFIWMLWLIVVVVVTDVLGYFAGRMIGGPKFWPAVSPKKTWSGTIFGWIGATVVGVIFVSYTGASFELVGISIAVAMASQMGDIAESAVKRMMGVKDSSTLIPGHGGVLDRFDGMLGAAVFLLLVGQFIGFPPGLV